MPPASAFGVSRNVSAREAYRQAALGVDASGLSARSRRCRLPIRPIRQCLIDRSRAFKRVTPLPACSSFVGISRFTRLRWRPVADRKMILPACKTQLANMTASPCGERSMAEEGPRVPYRHRARPATPSRRSSSSSDLFPRKVRQRAFLVAGGSHASDEMATAPPSSRNTR